MSGELVPRQRWERGAAELVARYAGFVNASDLSPEDQVKALASIVPMALRVVDEARDTIERLNSENEALRAADQIEDAVFAEEPTVPEPAPPGEHLCKHHQGSVGATHPCICAIGEDHYE